MKSFLERAAALKCSSKSSTDRNSTSPPSEQGHSEDKSSRPSFWSGFFSSAFSILDKRSDSSNCGKKPAHVKHNEWRAAVRKAVSFGSMWRIQECVLGSGRSGMSSSTSDIWLLGVCYRVSQNEPSGESDASSGLASFEEDFSSRVLITYRKGFDAIGDSKFTSDVGWGCMVRSSQMLVAQALLFHHLGRAWRKNLNKPLAQKYIEILNLFGDSEACAFSLHNLLKAGKAYGLAVGSWVGPYAMCRTWETLACSVRNSPKDLSLPMAIYVVSCDENGQRGGAPVVCIEDASKCCLEFSHGQLDWTSILLLVPLVLGLEKVNPRYIPLLRETFSFPQSLGIMGGKPGASTYIIGVQDQKAVYLDPHEVQQVVSIDKDDVEADTSSYHTNTIRHIPLDSVDPSLAIGFYCRDKADFDDFCFRASKLAEESNGAPLFTVTQRHKSSSTVSHNDVLVVGDGIGDDSNPMPVSDEGYEHESEWQVV